METNELYKKIGSLIKARRITKGLSTRDLGEIVGLNRTTISNIENANQKLYAHSLIEIAVALECKSIGELCPKVSSERLKTAKGNDLDRMERKGLVWLESRGELLTR